MGHELGLRERKKIQTRQTLWHTAMRLFVERGFDQVSVAEIAAAVDLSKMTVLNYFPTKADLVLSPLEEYVDEPARVVRARAAGEPALAALRRHFIAALAVHDVATGLNDDPDVLNVQRLLHGTPALMNRALAFQRRSEDLLMEEFVRAGQRPLTARLAAAQIMGVRNALVDENGRRLLGGESADTVEAEAVANAVEAFDMLENGLGGYCT